jgi:hypothetical protein
MRGLSDVVSVIMILIILLAVLIPVVLYAEYSNQYSTYLGSYTNNYVYLKQLQDKQVTTGHPSFFYNGSVIYAQYSNGTFVPSTNITIVTILYLNQQGVWQNITSLNYPITVSANSALQLPSYVNGRPIIIVTSLGNIYFLTPGSSIGPYSTTVATGGVQILAQITTQNDVFSVSTNVTTNIYGSFKNYTTPVAFPNQTGTFDVKAPQYVYTISNGRIYTGVFYNWIVYGASVNSTTSLGIRVTLQNKPAILIANYSLLSTYATLNVITNVPNVPVSVSIDGQTYTVYGSQAITIPAGYFNFTVVTLQANDTSQKSYGVIKHYTFSNIQYQGKTYTVPSQILFIGPNQNANIYVNYKNDFNYYYVTFQASGQYYPYVAGSVNPILNGTVYNYGQSYWIIGGNYSIGYTGVFYQNWFGGGYSYDVGTVTYKYANGTTVTYNFPNIPSYIVINQRITIIANYNLKINYVSL